MRRKRVRRRRTVTGQKTRTWMMTKIRKEKVWRAGVVESWTSWPPSLCHPYPWDQCEPWRTTT